MRQLHLSLENVQAGIWGGDNISYLQDATSSCLAQESFGIGNGLAVRGQGGCDNGFQSTLWLRNLLQVRPVQKV